MGVKFDKNETYFLATPEMVNEIKREFIENTEVCESSRNSLDIALSNESFQVFYNENNYNETIQFAKTPLFIINEDNSQSLKEKFQEQCLVVKGLSYEFLSDNIGTSSVGNYYSILLKVTTPEISYYMEGFFIEGRNSIIQVTINTVNKTNNQPLINSIEYINNEEYDDILIQSGNLLYVEDSIKALDKLSEAIELEPSNFIGYLNRAAINSDLGNYNQVLKDVEHILAIDELNVNGWLLKGMAHYYLKNYTEAITCFEEAQLLSAIMQIANRQNKYIASMAESYRFIGDAFLKLNNSEKAADNYQIALGLSFDSLNTAGIYNNLGMVKSQQNNPSEAIKFYSLSINSFPANANERKSQTFYNRGINYRKIERWQEAINDYTSAISLRPNFIEAYLNRSAAKLYLEDYEGTITDCNHIINLDDGKTEFTAIAYNNRGIAKLNLYDIEGCDDIKRAKSLGHSVLQEILSFCE